jgi:hypothetical protein
MSLTHRNVNQFIGRHWNQQLHAKYVYRYASLQRFLAQVEKWTSCFEISFGHVERISFSLILVERNKHTALVSEAVDTERFTDVSIHLRQHPRKKSRNSEYGLVILIFEDDCLLGWFLCAKPIPRAQLTHRLDDGGSKQL